MKRYVLIFLLMMTANVFGQWPIRPDSISYWIQDVKEGQCNNLNPAWETRGGIRLAALSRYGMTTLGGGCPDSGFYTLTGDFGSNPNHPNEITFYWPGHMIEDADLWADHPNIFSNMYPCYDGALGCVFCGQPLIDTLLWFDGFGFFTVDPEYSMWGITAERFFINTGIIVPWMGTPCPPGLPWMGKDPLYFTDSLYNRLPDSVILSGDSRLYLKAEVEVNLDSLNAYINLKTLPDSIKTIHMKKNDTLPLVWTGTYESARKLGLKSFNSVHAETRYPGSDTTIWGYNDVDVALPQILTQVDSVFTDTVFIRSDSMKVAKNLKVSLRLRRDADTTKFLAVKPLIDTLGTGGLGYKYKSRWVANAQCNNTFVKPDTMYRQFPRDTSSYLQWDKHTDSCRVTFSRDSLYAVGGKLTIVGKGKLKPVSNIDNSFLVSTDTLKSNSSDMLPTKRILIDKDPPNTVFIDSLKRDRIRAIAWDEYAGSADNSHCHNPFNDRLNHYWDDRIHNAETCRDSKMPCENAGSCATGIMQIKRYFKLSDTTSTWERLFRGMIHGEPAGFDTCSWDSLAWNWSINIFNGKYIHDIYNVSKINMNTKQAAFPESCSFDSCGSFPAKKNKEDLKSYGYHLGENAMAQILTDADWDKNIADTLHKLDGAIYVQNVRKYFYEKPWIHH